MSLRTQIDQDTVSALKEGNAFKKETLSYLRSILKNAEIDQKIEQLNDEQTVSIIQKEIKRRKEAIESYTVANKPDLAENEAKEIEILSAYLPTQMSAEEIHTFVTEFLKNNPADPAQIGRTIGAIAQELQGKADMSLVSSIVRQQVS